MFFDMIVNGDRNVLFMSGSPTRQRPDPRDATPLRSLQKITPKPGGHYDDK